jgi:glycosyltransferase involved in cell wall biosynthesis
MSTNAPLVSCIVPVYNGERYLGDALGSVFEQTHNNLEVLVVDDGSTDGSAEVACRFNNVQLIKKSNGGSASARNLGIAQARGDYVAFLDADDLWLPCKIERQLKTFEREDRLGICVAYHQNFWEHAYAFEAEQNPALARPQPGGGSTVMISRRALDKVGMLNEAFSHRDIQEWTMRASFGGWQVRMLEEVLVRRRIHAHNLSRSRVGGEPELLDIATALLARKRGRR